MDDFVAAALDCPWLLSKEMTPLEQSAKHGRGASQRKERRSPPRRGQRGRVEEVIQEMRKRVAHHDLAPGTRLQELMLAEQYGISRAMVREVLGALEQRGLVERIPNRGAVVARLDPKEVYEIFEVREVLEGLAVRRATLNAPDGTWDPFIERFGEHMKKAIAAGNIEVYIDALEELRALTLRYADNAHVSSFLDLVLDKARVIAHRVTLLPGRAEAGRLMHLELLDLMKSRNAEGAEKKKQEIIRSAREWLERYRSFVM